MLTNDVKTTIKSLEILLTHKTGKRSELNFEIVQITETIRMMKEVKARK